VIAHGFGIRCGTFFNRVNRQKIQSFLQRNKFVPLFILSHILGYPEKGGCVLKSLRKPTLQFSNKKERGFMENSRMFLIRAALIAVGVVGMIITGWFTGYGNTG
jgi:hypothetical protein